MGLINVRELLAFPAGDGGNDTETIINGVHFNRTALEFWNYTLYSNNTISNSSKCFLIFDQYQPLMLSNGSWINGTSCYYPYYGIGSRGKLSIAFAAFFATSIVFTLVNLRKHGKMYLREDKRFRIIGRRWQWYWMSFVAACGLISTLTGIDVDRNYLQGLSIVLQSFFFTLMVPGTLAMVWESVRHWGSWQERQIYDRDPYLLPLNDGRAKREFWLPLIFYLLAWMNFFMTIPRSWSTLELQRSEEQQRSRAEPSGTDSRLKAGSIIAASAWLVICISLWHSLHYYKPRTTGLWRRFNNFCHYCPTKLLLIIIVLAIRIAYAIVSAWEWETTILKYDVNPAWPFALGYGSTLILLVIMNAYGLIEENEDKQLIQQRIERGRVADAALGVTKKPSWWGKMHGGGTHLTPEERLRALTAEMGDPRPNRGGGQVNVELADMQPQTGSVRNRSRTRPPEDPFRDVPRGDPTDRFGVSGLESDAASTVTGTTMTGQTLTGLDQAPQQRVRSMLDV